MAAGHVVLERPDWTRPRLAPSGDRFAAVRWHEGAANIWIGTSKSPLQLASDLRPWRLKDFHWSADGNALILELELAGAEQRALALLDLVARTMTRLTPGLGADARYAGQTSGDRPTVLVAVRYPAESGFHLQAVTPTGAVVTEWQSPARPVGQWLATGKQAVAVCTGHVSTDLSAGASAEATSEWWHTKLATASWSRVLALPAADGCLSRPLAFSADGRSLYALSTVGRDTLALVRMSPPSWQPETISADERFDITSVLMSPDGTGPDLVTTTDPCAPQSALTSEAAADLARLRDVANGAPATIIGRNASHCLAEILHPVGGPALLTFSRTSRAVSKPLPRFTGFARVRMQRRDPVTFTARDGRLVTAFMTRPDASAPWPVVVTIHDGPWSIDRAQMDPWAQSLAAAGFCCLQVNYRGSRGFGKAFRDAGDRQWSLAMQDDLIDAVQSAPVAEFADPRRIAAIGYGYGGYAALMLATQTEVSLACVAAASAPTDLVRYVSGLISFGGPPGLARAARIGHPIADQEQLTRTSPVNRALDFRCPVLLFHGRQDAEVPVSHATRLAESLREVGRPCELIIYEDEGHRYARPQNITDLRTKALDFLLLSLRSPADSSLG